MRLPRRPSPRTALLTGVIAVLVATNPVVSQAAGQITSADIKNGTIKVQDLSKPLAASVKTSGRPGPRGAQGPRGPQGAPGAAGTLATLPFDQVIPLTQQETYSAAVLDGIQIEFECGDSRVGSATAVLDLGAVEGGDQFSYHALGTTTTTAANGTQTTSTTQQADDDQDHFQSPFASAPSAGELAQVSVSVEVVAHNGHELTLTAYLARDNRGGGSYPACTFVGSLDDNGAPVTSG